MAQQLNKILPIIAWLAFFLSPLAWPKTIDSYIAMDLLALALGLMATLIHLNPNKPNYSATWPWLFLLALITPVFIQLFTMEVRNPWKSWQISLYIISAWLVFRYAQPSSTKLISSESWFVLLGCVGNFYVVFAMLQDFNFHILPGNSTFPIWQETATGLEAH